MNSVKITILSALCLILLSSTTVGADLYLAAVSSESDVVAITSSGVDPVLRLQSGYLILAEVDQLSILQSAGVATELIESGISRAELAVSTQPQRQSGLDLNVVYEEGQLQVVRVEPSLSTEGRFELGLRSLEKLHPRVMVPRERRIAKTPFFDSADLDAVVGQVSEDSLHSYIAALQSYMVRRAGTSQNRAARDWIAAKLTSFGCDSVVVQPFDAYLSGTWITCYNVLGYKTGATNPNKYLITGAHFDAVPGSPGADDNGSGTAAVLEMARVFGGLQSDLTMVFALFDAEEYGLWGSDFYAYEASQRGDDIEYMLNLDMIAHYQNSGEAKLFHGPQTGYTLLFQQISEPLVGITSYLEGSSSGSDHFYFIQYGYEATFLHEMNFSTVYHSPQDSTGYMNYDYFTRMTKAALATLFVIDNGVMFSGDVTAGNRPLTVNFNSWTLDPPTSWAWDFGDGGTAAVAQPTYTYNSRGFYTVSLDVVSGGATHGLQRGNYIAVLDDTLSGDGAAAGALSVVEVTVNASNIVPVRQFEIPVEFAGDLPLTYQSFSTVGCRTENFNNQSIIHLDPFNNRFTIRLSNTQGDEFNVAAGSGPILKLYYYNSETAPSGKNAQIIFDGYSTHLPVFSGPIVTYNPTTTLPAIVVSGCCEGFRGNVNGDGLDNIDIADVTFLVNYMFKAGPVPPCETEANINGLGGLDIADLTYLVAYMFKSGPAPAACQ